MLRALSLSPKPLRCYKLPPPLLLPLSPSPALPLSPLSSPRPSTSSPPLSRSRRPTTLPALPFPPRSSPSSFISSLLPKTRSTSSPAASLRGAFCPSPEKRSTTRCTSRSRIKSETIEENR
ncbi:hypothetical protein BCR35DRAFT_305483 [Leucosporidium creatinivorum]|uniref:Uncharacterized protein n=1 Tax=Leucosporidium creatinivorum TaxID=106004 RepID=A0A1Y2F012_9BASI|nr:hypothetical protein BCR35DRAFT_305483 [Leucosporidium creatinivorum]